MTCTKKRSTGSRKPAKNSLAWFEREWKKMAGRKVPRAFIEALAQMAYTQKKILERLALLEEVQGRGELVFVPMTEGQTLAEGRLADKDSN